jgi:hypothetical protein
MCWTLDDLLSLPPDYYEELLAMIAEEKQG